MLVREIPYSVLDVMELEVFRRYKTKLSIAVSDNLLSVALECQAGGLITDKTYDEAIQLRSLIPKEKAVRLLDAVGNSITIDCSNYYKFMDILNGALPSACKALLAEMTKMLEDMRDLGKKVHTCTDAKMTEDSVVDVPKPPERQNHQKDILVRAGSKGKVSRSSSTDSGVSVGRNDSVVSDRDESLTKLNSIVEDLQPLEETPLQGDSDVKLHKEESSCDNLPFRSSRISERMLGVEETIRYLRCDTMQMEAAEIVLKEELEQLRKELNDALMKRNKTEKTLRVREMELRKLKRELETEKHTLESKDEEIDGLKARLSSSEVSKEKLRTQHKRDIHVYECEVDSLKAEVRECEQIIKNLRLQLERKNLETVLTYRHSNSIELKEEIKQKEAEAKAAKDELKHCKEVHSSEQAFAHKRENLYKFFLVFLSMAVIAMAIFLYYYKDSYCPLSVVGF